MFEFKLTGFVVFDVLYHFYFIVHDTKITYYKNNNPFSYHFHLS